MTKLPSTQLNITADLPVNEKDLKSVAVLELVDQDDAELVQVFVDNGKVKRQKGEVVTELLAGLLAPVEELGEEAAEGKFVVLDSEGRFPIGAMPDKFTIYQVESLEAIVSPKHGDIGIISSGSYIYKDPPGEWVSFVVRVAGGPQEIYEEDDDEVTIVDDSPETGMQTWTITHTLAKVAKARVQIPVSGGYENASVYNKHLTGTTTTAVSVIFPSDVTGLNYRIIIE